MKNGESFNLRDMNCTKYSRKGEPGEPGESGAYRKGEQGAPPALAEGPPDPQSGKVYTIHLGSSPPPPDASPPPDGCPRPRPRLSVDSQYDPYEHRETDAPTTNTETLVHLLKGSLGTGILAMPNAFHNAGLILGLVGTIFIGSLCTYCIHVLIRTQYEMCRRLRVPALSYPRTMEIALENGPSFLRKAAPYSGVVINIFLITYQLGICCVYIVFVASNIKDVVDCYWTNLNVRLYMLMMLVPLVLLNYVRNLKLLAPFSTLANAITFVGLGITLYYVFDEMPNPLERELIGSVRNFPLFIGTTLFALEAVGVIITLENNMKKPFAFRGYTGVLNKGMSIIVFLYVFMGFTGYVRYGDTVKGSITLNLPTDKLAQSVKIMFAVSIFITYALQCYVPVEIIWGSYISPRVEKSSPRMQMFWEYVLRTAIVLGTFLLAAAIPQLELFISLFGALCLSALGIAFPAFIELCLLWPRQAFGRYSWILVKDLLLLICGAVALVIGTYTSLRDIITSLL